jgi:hypothetical protein
MSASAANLMGYFHPQQVIQAVNRIEVGRIGERDGERVAVFKDWNDAILFRDMTRDPWR